MNCMSMWDYLLNLLRDHHAQEEFRRNPVQHMHDHNMQHVTAGDVHDLMHLVTDHPGVEPIGDHGFSSPPPIFPEPGESETHCAGRLIDHFTKCYTYNVDNHTTFVDDSTHDSFWAPGGDIDLNQEFDSNNVVAGDHSVAAGGDIWGNTTTGNDNALGAHSAVGLDNVTGNGDNAAFGAGSAAGQDNSLINGSHDVQGDGNVGVNGPAIGSQFATNGGINANDNHLVSDGGGHWASDSGNTDLHSFGAGAGDSYGEHFGHGGAGDGGDGYGEHSGYGGDGHGEHFGHGGDGHGGDGYGEHFGHGGEGDSYGEHCEHFGHGGEGGSYGVNDLQSNCDSHGSLPELNIIH